MSAPRRPVCPATHEYGSVLGAVVFALVAAGVLVGGYFWLQARRTQDGDQTRRAWSGAADEWTGRLGKFLAKGPSGGTWETRFLSSTCRHYISQDPARPGVFLIAQVEPDGSPGETQAVSRWLVPRHFFRAPSSLFFSNYQRSEAPVRERLPNGTDTWRVHWAPRVHPEGLTERRVWFTVAEGAVVQVEDHSRSGHLIHRVRQIAEGTGDWDPQKRPDEESEHCEIAPPDPNADPERVLLEAVDDAPFPVYKPRHIPAGFVLVRSSYSICDAARSTESLQGEPVQGRQGGTPVHLVTQLYSDGMALISVAVAPREDMDVIETVTAGMGDAADPGSCPGLPAEPRKILQDDTVVRLRTDVCRIVLRRDDLAGASVTLIGRNELPTEEYLRMISSLEEVPSLD